MSYVCHSTPETRKASSLNAIRCRYHQPAEKATWLPYRMVFADRSLRVDALGYVECVAQAKKLASMTGWKFLRVEHF